MVNKDNAGRELLRHRLDKNITQVEVAEKSGVSVQTISGIEGGNVPQSMTIYKLNQYFEKIKPCTEAM